VRLVHPDDEAPGRIFLDGLKQAPAAVAGVHWRLRHADGTYREFETAGSNALGEPAVAGLVLNSRDVTDRRLLEEELRQSHKLEAIGRLVGGIAHNFNNLLASTFLRLDLIRRARQLPPELEQEIAGLETGTKRTAALILQLQSVGQVRMLRRKQIELGAMLADLRPELERLVGEPIELVLVDDGRPKWIEADGTLINQVILTLSANARDAMPQGGRLTITLARGESGTDAGEPGLPGDHVCLSFQDTGRGIDEPTRQRLFEPFFTTKDVGLGLGLGLAAAQGIVQQHDGRLAVASAVGRGSTFRILLPVAPDPNAAPAAARPPPADRKLHRRLIPRTAAKESGR
jgi:signal transduction histidine kinase